MKAAAISNETDQATTHNTVENQETLHSEQEEFVADLSDQHQQPKDIESEECLKEF